MPASCKTSRVTMMHPSRTAEPRTCKKGDLGWRSNGTGSDAQLQTEVAALFFNNCNSKRKR
jgi:hypothetical protein